LTIQVSEFLRTILRKNSTRDAGNACKHILSYSPHDNVAARDYPAIVAMAGLTDPRVTYREPAK